MGLYVSPSVPSVGEVWQQLTYMYIPDYPYPGDWSAIGWFMQDIMNSVLGGSLSWPESFAIADLWVRDHIRWHPRLWNHVVLSDGSRSIYVLIRACGHVHKAKTRPASYDRTGQESKLFVKAHLCSWMKTSTKQLSALLQNRRSFQVRSLISGPLQLTMVMGLGQERLHESRAYPA